MSAECEKCGTDLVGTQWDEGGLSCRPCNLEAENARLQKRGEYLYRQLGAYCAVLFAPDERIDRYKALAERRGEALKEMLRHGEHGGPCTDESGDPRGPDTYKGEGCLLHWQTSQQREDLARAAIAATPNGKKEE